MKVYSLIYSLYKLCSIDFWTFDVVGSEFYWEPIEEILQIVVTEIDLEKNDSFWIIL